MDTKPTMNAISVAITNVEFYKCCKINFFHEYERKSKNIVSDEATPWSMNKALWRKNMSLLIHS